MRPSRAWLYGGGVYVFLVASLFVASLSVHSGMLSMAVFLASLPCGLIAMYVNYFVLVALVLLGADPMSESAVLDLFFVPAQVGAAVGNVVLAWVVWSALRSCMERFRDNCRGGALRPG